MRCSALLGQGDVDVVALDADGVDGDGDDGRRAGRLPVRRSKREPCSQHSRVQPSSSPSDSETLAWRAGVVDAVHVAVGGVHDRDPATLDLGQGGAHGRQLVEPADPHEAGVGDLLAHAGPRG